MNYTNDIEYNNKEYNDKEYNDKEYNDKEYNNKEYNDKEYGTKEGNINGKNDYEYYKRVESDNSLASSHAANYDHSMSPSVSIHDLEEHTPYEIHWHVGADYIPTYVVALFTNKILNYDSRYNTTDSQECTDLDLVFQHLKTGNMFTIHSDLIDEGMVEFYMMHDDMDF